MGRQRLRNTTTIGPAIATGPATDQPADSLRGAPLSSRLLVWHRRLQRVVHHLQLPVRLEQHAWRLQLEDRGRIPLRSQPEDAQQRMERQRLWNTTAIGPAIVTGLAGTTSAASSDASVRLCVGCGRVSRIWPAERGVRVHGAVRAARHPVLRRRHSEQQVPRWLVGVRIGRQLRVSRQRHRRSRPAGRHVPAARHAARGGQRMRRAGAPALHTGGARRLLQRGLRREHGADLEQLDV